MNMLATQFLPTDNQLYCWHMLGIVARADGGQVIIDRDNAALLDKLGGYKFSYCPIYGGRLEVAE